MAIDVVIETRIGRPLAEVFARVADIDRWPEWLNASGIVRVERASDGPLAAGERLTVEQRAAGRAGTFAATVTALLSPERIAIQGRDEDGVSIDIDASLAPVDELVTSLRWSIRIGLPFRYRIFESMARPQVERAAALDLEALRRRLESVATD
ncbi:MAG: SRPBCC family protein [Chloroflexota bacterium]